jgi:hypothetical protein
MTTETKSLDQHLNEREEQISKAIAFHSDMLANFNAEKTAQLIAKLEGALEMIREIKAGLGLVDAPKSEGETSGN